MENFFKYSKKLTEKIAYYDALANGEFAESRMTNPFAQPINITIIWVDEDNLK